jgi:glutathione peroxidase|tara:strand:+ start:101 stop:583 length:483 start_codon:yes stop_codon:yes gene_type:complete
MAKLDLSTPVRTLAGDTTDLSAYQGKVLLIVNTASKCGLTPQYAGLEALYKQYAGQGLEILGFPCNQFGKQEPGTESAIQEFCQINYGVSFPMHAKIDVNGSETHPVFQQLKQAAPGILGSKGIKWNFTKFLVAKDGTIVTRFSPKTEPKDMEKDIQAQL